MADKGPCDFQLCPKFEQTFSILGRKWNGLIIDVLLHEGDQRFKDLAAKVSKCSDRVLVERLRELEEDQLVKRLTHEDSSLITYQLTPQGLALKPIMREIHQYSEQWN